MAIMWSGTQAGAQGREIAFSDLPGWHRDDHASALAAFRLTCGASSSATGEKAPRISREALNVVCRKARAFQAADAQQARLFFETHFKPVVLNERGFLTAYFEPVVPGSNRMSKRFTTPLLSLPDRRAGPMPSRAEIEAGALAGQSHALVYLDPVDAFFAHIQGSVRVRIEDGRELRLAYAGRNGHSYTPIGRVLVERGILAREEVTMDSIAAWLRQNPTAGRDLMQENRSYIFFRVDDTLRPGDGPVGGAGVPLTPGRSLAIDRSHWPYGLPIWIEADLPWGAGGAATALQQLTIAQDTGTAIVGPARADFFVGVGPEAGSLAGVVRHSMRMVVLVPRAGAVE